MAKQQQERLEETVESLARQHISLEKAMNKSKRNLADGSNSTSEFIIYMNHSSIFFPYSSSSPILPLPLFTILPLFFHSSSSSPILPLPLFFFLSFSVIILRVNRFNTYRLHDSLKRCYISLHDSFNLLSLASRLIKSAITRYYKAINST